MKKASSNLPLLLGAGLLALLLAKKSAGGTRLTGDDAKDAMNVLRDLGAPPELLNYLAKNPALLREAMEKGTINGKPLPQAAKPGRGGGGGGGGRGGIGSMKGGTDIT